MKFLTTLATLFVGLAAASPLAVRDPQGSIDPGFLQPVPPSRGPKNSKGLTQENWDDIRRNYDADFAAESG